MDPRRASPLQRRRFEARIAARPTLRRSPPRRLRGSEPTRNRQVADLSGAERILAAPGWGAATCSRRCAARSSQGPVHHPADGRMLLKHRSTIHVRTGSLYRGELTSDLAGRATRAGSEKDDTQYTPRHTHDRAALFLLQHASAAGFQASPRTSVPSGQGCVGDGTISILRRRRQR